MGVAMSVMIGRRRNSMRRDNDAERRGTVVRTITTTESRRRTAGLTAVLAGAAMCSGAAALAQQGHPLVGSWSGDWGPDPAERHRVLLVLDYDGQALKGVINPGRAPIVLTSATLDPADWSVRLEAAPSAQTGGVRYLIEGQIENLGSITERTIVGTWMQGERHGEFRIVMN